MTGRLEIIGWKIYGRIALGLIYDNIAEVRKVVFRG
jgi:hypothetical protein